MYAIYQLPKSKKPLVDKMLADDIIGRQAITQKDALSFGLEDDKLIVMYEGSEEGKKRLDDLFGKELSSVNDEKSAQIYKSIKDEESQAEDGLGFIFG